MRKRENRKLIPVIRIVIVIIILMLFSTIFALLNVTNANIIKNVKINNIDVAGLSKNETEKKFENIIENILDNEIVLKHGDIEKTYTLKRMELETDYIDKVYEACNIGRESNIFANNFRIIQVLLSGENLELNFKFNEEIMQSIMSNLDEEWEEKFVDNSYYIDGENLIIVRGKQGPVVDEMALREKITEFIRAKIEGKDVKEIEIPIITKEPGIIDIEKIEKDVFKEARNASYDRATSKLIVHSNGVEFGISTSEAKQIVSEDKAEYIIPLQIMTPQITTDMLGEDAFPNILGSFSTRYDASNINRATNIEIASEEINGLVLEPGEKFSFNSIVGPTTVSKGYMLAGAYSAGELVESYGGGICQVSSTIYNAVLYANLEIVERYNHSSVVSYVDPGRDATISYGSKDLKFLNSRNYPIKIYARTNNGILDVEIRGIFEDNEYEIELISEKTETILCDTKYVYDSSLAEGQEVVQTYGANGAKSIAYKIVKKNGKILSKNILSEDSYNPMMKVVKTGSKK